MFSYAINRFVKNRWWWCFWTILSAFVMMWLFGVSWFDPWFAQRTCRNIDVPKEVLFVQSQYYCECVQDSEIKDPDKRSQSCIKSMQSNKQLVRELVKP